MGPNQTLPEIVRMEALRGFRAVIDGQFGIAEKGDVVNVPLAVAIDLRHSQKAVMTEKPLRRQAAEKKSQQARAQP